MYGIVFKVKEEVNYDKWCNFQRLIKRLCSTSKCKKSIFDRKWVGCDIFFCPFQVVLALICPLMIHQIVFYDEEYHKWSVPLCKKLVIFYNAPISKFWAHLVSKLDFTSILHFQPICITSLILVRDLSLASVVVW